MIKIRADKKLIAAVVVGLAAAGVGFGLFASAGSSTTVVPMPDPSVWYEHFGVVITPPQNASPAVSADEAAAAATQVVGGDVLNHELAHCQIPGDHPAVNQDCYVELVNPTHAIAGQVVSWFVVLVDPTTGKPFQWFSEGPSSAPPASTSTTP